VMYVLPSSVNFAGTAAYAYVGGRRSVYKDNNVAMLLVQMHEIGHNLKMAHSGRNSSPYGDKTCFEGAHICFIF
jgi:hypothetical protein